jgi:hypothetical protein
MPRRDQRPDAGLTELGVLKRAMQLQCANATVPMPCDHRTQMPIFHCHMAKMAGRSTFVTAPGKVGQPLCRWAPARHEYGVDLQGRAGVDFVRTHDLIMQGERLAYREFANAVHLHRRELARQPCFTSFEMPYLAAMTTIFGPAGLTPLVATMIRDPHSWVLSALEHDMKQGRHSGLDDLLARGCLTRPKPNPCERTYDYTQPMARLYEPATHNRFEIGRRRLDGMLVGLVNEFGASMCLWAFQTGQHVGRDECDCRQNEAKQGDEAEIGHVSSEKEVFLMRNASHEARDALQRLEFGVDGPLFAYASTLFVQRVRVAEAALGFPLLCGASAAPALWPHTSILDRWIQPADSTAP